MKKPIRLLWAACTLGAFLSSALLAALFWLPFAQARAIADRFAKDGSMESFSPGLYQHLHLPLSVLAVLLALLGIALLVWRHRAQVWLEAAIAYGERSLRRWAVDFRPFWQSLLRELGGVRRWEWVLLLAVIALGAALRWLQISRAMQHDESYTYEAFASESLRYITSNYHLPNNHVLHTILVFFSTRLFGIEPWAVRFPAFMAGMLAIPLGFLLARRLYGAGAAVLCACLVAVYPDLIDYATNARGYTLVALLTLVLLLLAVYVKDHRNLAAWSLLAIAGALGFYTVPIMLYPFGAVLAWLFFSALAGDFGGEYGSRWIMIRYLAVAGVGTLALTGMLYLPIIRGMGLNALTGNVFVQSLAWSDFRQTAVSRLQDTLTEWRIRLPALTLWVLGLGFLLSLVLHWRITKARIPLQAAFIVWIGAALLYQRPNPWPKIWYFLVPVLLMWVSAGWLAPLRGLERRRWGWLLAGGLSLAVAIGGTAVELSSLKVMMTPSPVEQSAIYLHEALQPEDVVVVDVPDDAPMWYYLRLHGVPATAVHGIKSRPFTRAYVVVNTWERQTIPQVISARGPDLVFLNVGAAQPVAQYGPDTIFLVDSYPELVKKAYNLK